MRNRHLSILYIFQDNTEVKGISSPAGSVQLCSAVTDNKGEFVFGVVPPGKYYLIPHYQSTNTRYVYRYRQIDIYNDRQIGRQTELFLLANIILSHIIRALILGIYRNSHSDIQVDRQTDRVVPPGKYYLIPQYQSTMYI